MRIAILGPTYPFRGGIAQYTASLAQALAQSGDETLLISFAEGYPRFLFPGQSDRDPSDSAVQAPAEYLLSPWRPWTWVQTARRLARFDPDLCVVQWWVPFWAPSFGATLRLLRRQCATRVVAVCHNVAPHEGGGRLARWLTHWALAPADAFLVHSRTDADRLARRRPEAPVEIASLPDVALGRRYERAAARQPLSLTDDEFVGLFFGFVRPYKGLTTLLDAVPRIVADVPNFKLLVVGEFWTPRRDFEAQARRLGVADRVVFVDRYVPNEEVGLYFGAADVAVFPYAEATQSAVVPLAYRYGVPVVATAVGGLPEAVAHGETGLLVPPRDPEALAGAVVSVLTDSDLRRQLVAAGSRRRAAAGWDQLADALRSLATPAPQPAWSVG